jgi:hypothetical protein
VEAIHTPSDRLLTQQEINDALAGFKAAHPPVSLYRFHSGAALSALTEGRLKITPPKEFNDPFEIAPGIVSDGLTKEVLRHSFLSPTGLARMVYAKRCRDEATYCQWVESVVLEAPHLWEKTLHTMRSAMTEATSAAYGVTCFSAFTEEILNGPIGIRHWAMYAGNHEGFVIEYDGGHPLLRTWALSKWLFPVVYHVDRPLVQITDFDDWPQQKALKLLRSWSAMKCKQAWGEEMEWRLICQLAPDETGKIEISRKEADGRTLYFYHLWKSDSPPEKRPDSAAIKRVILGVRTSEKLTTEIRDALGQPHLTHVELWRSRMSESRYSLQIAKA